MNCSIIGSAGRGIPTEFQSSGLYEKMYTHCSEKLKTLSSKPELVSGGAAWADHLAVSLALREDYPLTLYFPCGFENGSFVDNGKQDWKTNPGKTANYYHRLFSKAVGIDSLKELSEVISKPNVKVIVGKGFHDRNKYVASTTYLLAYFWSDGEESEPVDGGTKHTWDLAGKLGCKRRAVNVRLL
jgi:hypothetical protein